MLKVPAAALAASGCDRCADTFEWRDIPAESYKEGALGRFTCGNNQARRRRPDPRPAERRPCPSRLLPASR